MTILIDAVGIKMGGAGEILTGLLSNFEYSENNRYIILTLNRNKLTYTLPAIKAKNIIFREISFVENYVLRIIWFSVILPLVLRFYRTDVLFSFNNFLPFFCPKIKKIVYLHNSLLFQPYKNIYSKNYITFLLLKYSMHHSSKIIVQTNSMLSEIAGFNGSVSGKVLIIPAGAAKENNHPLSPELVKVIKENSLITTYISLVGKHKNHEVVLRAIALLKKKYPGIKLILPLDKEKALSEYDYELLKNIRNLVQALEIEENVIFMGSLNKDEIYYLLRNCSFSIFPSLKESFGLGLAESIYCNCPILAADLPYAHEVAKDAAVYFDPYSYTDLAYNIEMLLNYPEYLSGLKNNCSKYVELYNYKNISSQIMSALIN